MEESHIWQKQEIMEDRNDITILNKISDLSEKDYDNKESVDKESNEEPEEENYKLDDFCLLVNSEEKEINTGRDFL